MILSLFKAKLILQFYKANIANSGLSLVIEMEILVLNVIVSSSFLNKLALIAEVP